MVVRLEVSVCILILAIQSVSIHAGPFGSQGGHMQHAAAFHQERGGQATGRVPVRRGPDGQLHLMKVAQQAVTRSKQQTEEKVASTPTGPEEPPPALPVVWEHPPLLCNCSAVPTKAEVDAANPLDPTRRIRLAYALRLSTGGRAAVASLVRLLHAIHHEDNVVAIHVDSRVPDSAFDSLQAAVARNPQLARMAYFVPRSPVSPHGITVVSTLMRIMSYLLRHELQWDYWINLPGTAYPLVTQDALRRMLASLPVPVDLTSVTYPQWLGGSTLRAGAGAVTDPRRWMDPAVAGKSLAKEGVSDASLNGPPSTFDVQLVPNTPFDAQHMSVQACEVVPASYMLRRASVEYLIYDPEGTVREWLLFFAYTFAPDERFFATVLAHAPLNGTMLAHGLLCGEWAPGPSATTLDDSHLDMLRACRGAFAHKFAPNSPVLDRIDREFLYDDASNHRMAQGMLDTILGQFLPWEALRYEAVGAGAATRSPGFDAAGSTQGYHSWSQGEESLGAASEVFVSVKPAWIDQFSLQTAKYDICRDPFLMASKGSLPGGGTVVNKAVLFDAAHGITHFSGLCCPAGASRG